MISLPWTNTGNTTRNAVSVVFFLLIASAVIPVNGFSPSVKPWHVDSTSQLSSSSSFLPPTARPEISRTLLFSARNGKSPKNSFLKQMDGESSSDYMKRLSKIASDPSLFEQTVKEEEQQANNNTSNETGTTSAEESEPKKKGYVRAEEWDAQHNADHSWDQKVAFDGQRFGNRFNQNEILRKNLNQF